MKKQISSSNHLNAVAACCFCLGMVATSHGTTYHVSIKGDDANSGSEAAPCKTIQRVAGFMLPGDTCVIHAGIYRETVRPGASGTADKPIKFIAAAGEKVVVAGTVPVDGTWAEHEKGILKTTLEIDDVPQILAAGRLMLQARWPNAKADDLLGIQRSKAGPGTDYDGVVALGRPGGDLTGATILLWPGRAWDNATRIITGVRGEKLLFDRDFRPKKQDKRHGFDPFKPEQANDFVLYGALTLLDSPGEWFFEKGSKTLYWKPVSGVKPEDLEVRVRPHGFSLNGLSDIHVKGIDLVGCGFDMVDAQRCVIRDCTCVYSDYPTHVDIYKNPDMTNIVTGSGNRIERCTFAYAALSALRVAGENNTITDCVIHTSNYLGAHKASIHADKSKGLKIQYCTIRGSGRELIHFLGASKMTIKYCDVSDGNRLSNDTGALKCWGTDGQGSVIAHNWVHDNRGRNTVGVYLDNYSKNFDIHHNVIWNNSGAGIRLNSPSNHNDVFHNTVLKNGKSFAVFTYRGKTPDQSGTRIINNLYSGEMQIVEGEQAPEQKSNIQVNPVGLLPPTPANTVHAPNRPGRDEGVVIEGFRIETAGVAPDVGAHEAGKPFWKPGPRKPPRQVVPQ